MALFETLMTKNYTYGPSLVELSGFPHVRNGMVYPKYSDI